MNIFYVYKHISRIFIMFIYHQAKIKQINVSYLFEKRWLLCYINLIRINIDCFVDLMDNICANKETSLKEDNYRKGDRRYTSQSNKCAAAISI